MLREINLLEEKMRNAKTPEDRSKALADILEIELKYLNLKP